MVANICIPSSWETEAGRSCIKFKASNIARPCLERKKKKNKEEKKILGCRKREILCKAETKFQGRW
jgi:hypothetical protein